jgi:hypothetical protein
LEKLFIVHMTIWLLAVLLVAGLGAFGLRQGVIRVSLSFIGIVLGGLLAAPLGHLFKPLLSALGLKHPIWLAFLPPCIGFLLVLTIFKIVGYVLHKKAEVHFKYKANEVQQAMWERLDHRLGLCVGLFNGAAYLVLLSAAVYLLSYWTYQVATPDSDPRTLRFINQMGIDLQRTGMNRVAVSVDKMPPTYYEAADAVGMIYHNPLLEARLSRYPVILQLGERPELQDLANDQGFTDLRMRQASLMEIINHPKVQAILQNPELVKTITNAILPNLSDLTNFLATDSSQVFTDKILGEWDFDTGETISLYARAQPKMSATEKARLRAFLSQSAAKARLICTPDNVAVLKDYPHVNTTTKPPTISLETYQGRWDNATGSYQVTLSIGGKEQQLAAEIHNDRLGLSSSELNVGFAKED